MVRNFQKIGAGWTLFTLLFLAFAFALLFNLNMQRGLNHDEHQFVASGVLLAQAGLLPYQDYAYFHTPYLTYIYALLFRGTTYYLLTARLFSIACSFGLIVTLYGVTLRLFQTERPLVRYGLATGSVLLLLAAPIFTYTSGRAWNHDWPVLLIVWGLLIAVHALHHPKTALWVIAGALLGLAIGARLSLMTALPAFLVLPFLPSPAERRQRMGCLAAFLAGLLIASLPLLYAFAAAPQAFLFGNLDYARLNTLYRTLTAYEEGMTWVGKARFVGLELLWHEPGNLLLLVLYLVWGLPRRFQRDEIARHRALFAILALLPCLLMGALAPTPARSQYFYLLFPFLLLGALLGLRAYHQSWVRKAGFGGLGGVLIVMVAVLNGDEYQPLDKLVQPNEWFPVEIHQTGLKIAALLGEPAKVLTAAPILALEGGAHIYPQLATGPFALRAARFLSKPEEDAYHLLSDEALAASLANDPPRAVLVGVDAQDAAEETPLIEYARRQGYTDLPLAHGQHLWVQPLAEWQNQVRLAAFELPTTSVQPGARFGLMLYLQSTAPIPHNINVIVRVVDAGGKVWVHDEGWPWGKPTAAWQPGDLWFDGHALTMPAAAPPGFYRVDITFFDPEAALLLPGFDLRRHAPIESFKLGYLTVGNWPPRPAQPLTAPLMWGEAIALLGVEIGAEALQPGDALTIDLDWQAQKQIETDYTVFVHLIGPDGKLAAQQDKQPLDGFLPTSRWQAQMVVPDQYVLTLPPAAQPGRYTVQVGLYDLTNGQRLPIWRNGDAIGDAAAIGSVTVQ